MAGCLAARVGADREGRRGWKDGRRVEAGFMAVYVGLEREEGMRGCARDGRMNGRKEKERERK